MGKVVVSMISSVDGFIATKNGELDWVFPNIGPEAQGQISADLQNTDTILVGRVNYSLMEAAFTGQDNPIANIMNALPKLVFSNTLDKVDWINSRLIKGDVAEEVNLLKEQTEKDLRVLGGAKVVQSLTDLGLIDRYELLTVPVVLGEGIPLFNKPVDLKLEKSVTQDSSCVLTVWTRA